MDDLISRKMAIDLFPDDDLEWDTNGGYIAPHLARQMICELPTAQPEPTTHGSIYAETAEKQGDRTTDGLISRKSAIDSICRTVCDNPEICESPCDEVKILEIMPSAQPERLTDDDFETIRIHLNAYKEKLCNQHRWEEADEYQRIIDRFMAFASAQPEQTNSWCINSWCNNCKDIVRCKDCKYNSNTCGNYVNCDIIPQMFGRTVDNFCSMAERRTDD